MLDGLLGRGGFSSKCKSLIKPTRARIEVLRRRAEAKQRFLKEDLAKLLANGLDINAYGRTEEFIAGLNLLSCYNFIEQSCEYILKQLSVMQKQGACPEECRETVASLMFAAARFSDLPELRDLRDVFQERYGNGFECYVNQVLVEKLASKPPMMEMRMKLLQDIAVEFSILWDSKGFKRRMEKPSTLAQDQTKKLGPPSAADDKYKLPNGKNASFENDKRSRERIENAYDGKILHNSGNRNGIRGEALNVPFVGRENKHVYKHEAVTSKAETIQNGENRELFSRASHESSSKKHGSSIGKKDTPWIMKSSGSSSHDRSPEVSYNDKMTDFPKGEKPDILYHEKVEVFSNRTKLPLNGDRKDNIYVNGQQNAVKSTGKVLEEETEKSKSCYSNSLPPPYVKLNIPPPYSKPKDHGTPESSVNQSPQNEPNLVVKSSRIKKEPDDGLVEDRRYLNDIPLPKPRSIRRKHSKSSSSHGDVESSEDARIVKRISSSRRKDKKGLQILFDDEHYHRDEEERMMDKLLLHYSRKSSASDMGKLRKKKSRSNTSKDEAEIIVPPTRSISLPHEQSSESEPKKVFARANSFQPDNQARHVHPKLPDYDDLAARFAALRGR